MNKPDQLERFQTLAAGFVIDNLDDKEEEEFRLLLVQYPELAREIDDLQQVLTLVLDEFTDVEVPTHLHAQIRQQAEAELASRSSQVSSTSSRKNTRFSGQKWFTVIASVIVLLLGAENYRLRHQFANLRQENQQLAQQVGQVQAVNSLLQESETKLVTFQGKKEMAMTNVSGSILVNNRKKQALMMVKNLPAPPQGKHYVLWAIIADDKVPCGEVKPKSWGDSLSEVPFTPEMARDFFDSRFQGLSVTLEDNAQTLQPQGPIVMQSSDI